MAAVKVIELLTAMVTTKMGLPKELLISSLLFECQTDTWHENIKSRLGIVEMNTLQDIFINKLRDEIYSKCSI